MRISKIEEVSKKDSFKGNLNVIRKKLSNKLFF
jgi:hypothetical protein